MTAQLVKAATAAAKATAAVLSSPSFAALATDARLTLQNDGGDLMPAGKDNDMFGQNGRLPEDAALEIVRACADKVRALSVFPPL